MAAAPGMVAGLSCTFEQLLERIRSEHWREVGALRRELEGQRGQAARRHSGGAGGGDLRQPAALDPTESPGFDPVVPGVCTPPLRVRSSLEGPYSRRPQLPSQELAPLPGSITARGNGSLISSTSSEASQTPSSSLQLCSQAASREAAQSAAAQASASAATVSGRNKLSRGVSFDTACIHSSNTEDAHPPKKAKFELRSWWREECRVEQRRHASQLITGSASLSGLAGGSPTQKPRDIDFEDSQLNWCISDPHSWRHFCWDLTGMLLIICDCLVVPLETFQQSCRTRLQPLFLVTTFFWSLDIIRTFLVGYQDRGESVRALRPIALHYGRTWLGPDLLLTGLDWALCLATVLGEEGLMCHFRLLRLFRVAKTYRTMKRCEERIESEQVSIVFQIAKQLSSIILMCHVIACIWYAIGSNTSPDGTSWLLEHGLDEASPAYQYATSFHWALTQFTPASIGVQPQNIQERCFAVVVLLFALIMFSLFISGITSALMDLRKLSSAKSQQLWVLRRYLTEAGVPKEISLRVQRYCSCAWDVRMGSVQEQSVSALELLSAPLRAELRTAIFEPRLGGHPFFVLINKIAPLAMQLICTNAVARVSVARGDVLFQSGQEADKMMFINTGSLAYVLEEVHEASVPPKNVPENERSPTACENVEAGSYVGEAALWMEWTYVGSLHARHECELVTMDAVKFHSAVCSNRHTKAEATMYARKFQHSLNRLDGVTVTDVHQSMIIEGLWFRLMNEFQVKRQHSFARGKSRSAITLSTGTHSIESGITAILSRTFMRQRRDSSDSTGMQQFESY